MLPIVGKSTIQYIIEEVIDLDTEGIFIITTRSKKSIENHFHRFLELELLKAGK